ncbi:MAG: pyrimidine-nucleoside phosphorylase [Syntrophothermus sp.]
MRVYDLIQKKRDGGKLASEEISFLIQGYTVGEIPDYQMAAFAMAVFFRGMDAEETAALTMAMVDSGQRVDLGSIAGRKVDKHSTGGVGDTTTLILAPLVAAAGVPVPKMSGRGLGHTGGTIDKLESIPGFRVELGQAEFVTVVNRVKMAVVGQTANLAPADKKLYALRDVTATIESVPLIASSIMSKKIAAGADAITLDVKCGSGAFMKTKEEAVTLGEAMVEIGRLVGRETIAVVSDMNQPLGNAIGNALEVREAIETLQGRGPARLTELCLTLGAQMLVLGERARTAEEGREILERILRSGAGLEKFKEFVAAQGGDPRVADDPGRLPQPAYQLPVLAPCDGFIQRVDAEAVGLSAMLLGAGRAKKEDAIDLAVGVQVARNLGDRIRTGEPLAVIYTQDRTKAQAAEEKLLSAYQIGPEPVEPPPLIYEILR